MPAVIHCAKNNSVCKRIQLLYDLSLNIFGSRRAQGIDETGLHHFTIDDFEGKREIAQECGEIAGGAMRAILLLDNVTLNGYDFI